MSCPICDRRVDLTNPDSYRTHLLRCPGVKGLGPRRSKKQEVLYNDPAWRELSVPFFDWLDKKPGMATATKLERKQSFSFIYLLLKDVTALHEDIVVDGKVIRGITRDSLVTNPVPMFHLVHPPADQPDITIDLNNADFQTINAARAALWKPKANRRVQNFLAIDLFMTYDLEMYALVNMRRTYQQLAGRASVVEMLKTARSRAGLERKDQRVAAESQINAEQLKQLLKVCRSKLQELKLALEKFPNNVVQQDEYVGHLMTLMLYGNLAGRQQVLYGANVRMAKGAKAYGLVEPIGNGKGYTITYDPKNRPAQDHNGRRPRQSQKKNAVHTFVFTDQGDYLKCYMEKVHSVICAKNQQFTADSELPLFLNAKTGNEITSSDGTRRYIQRTVKSILGTHVTPHHARHDTYSAVLGVTEAADVANMRQDCAFQMGTSAKQLEATYEVRHNAKAGALRACQQFDRQFSEDASKSEASGASAPATGNAATGNAATDNFEDESEEEDDDDGESSSDSEDNETDSDSEDAEDSASHGLAAAMNQPAPMDIDIATEKSAESQNVADVEKKVTENRDAEPQNVDAETVIEKVVVNQEAANVAGVKRPAPEDLAEHAAPPMAKRQRCPWSTEDDRMLKEAAQRFPKNWVGIFNEIRKPKSPFHALWVNHPGEQALRHRLTRISTVKPQARVNPNAPSRAPHGNLLTPLGSSCSYELAKFHVVCHFSRLLEFLCI